MTYPSSDPYLTPSALPPKPSMAAPPMRYLESFQYIFAHPEWVLSVILASVCGLIPVIGGILVLGYQFEIVELLHRSPGNLYPKFDFNRFSQYLMRGVWPFLVVVIVVLVVQLPLMCGFYMLFFGVVAGASNAGDAGPVVAILGMLCVMLVFFALMAAMSIFLTPVALRAGLAQDLGQALKFDWVMNFVSKMWVETLLTSLFLSAVSIFILAPLILLTCGLGGFFANTLLAMAGAHLNWQLYTIYLARGGEPIPLKPWDGPAPLMPKAM
jgi:uncharacterized protein DUF4013